MKNSTPKKKLYLFLARRDKKDIKIIATFPGQDSAWTQVLDVKTLGLPIELETKIAETVYQHRFYWELWLAPADDYYELKAKLLKKGYRVPRFGKPMHLANPHRIVKESEYTRRVGVDKRVATSNYKTMTRKKN